MFARTLPLLLFPALLPGAPCPQARELITARHFDQAEKALETCAAEAGARAQRLAPVLREVARGYASEHRNHDAERVYRRVLSLWEAAAPGQPVVAASLRDIAGVAAPAEAPALMERSASIIGSASGLESPAFGLALDKLAEALASAGRPVEAAAAYARALAILDAALGPENMMSAALLDRYAEVLAHAGRSADAQRHRDRAAAIRAAKSAKSNLVSPPALIAKTEPAYSEEARAAGLQGSIVIYAEIDPDGRASRVFVMTPLGMGLDEAAVTAVKSWRFRPAYREGAPATVAATIEVNFRLG